MISEQLGVKTMQLLIYGVTHHFVYRDSIHFIVSLGLDIFFA